MEPNKPPKTNDETIMYTQLQPWSSIGASPCMEQIAGTPIPKKVGEYYRTPRHHPWRPTLGYENVELHPLPSQPITNLLADACYTPSGMSTEPLKFPNLVTGFERNPAHAARAALFTRYTPYEWFQNQIQIYNEADSNRHYSEKLRKSTECLMREADGKVQDGQKETGRKLGERLTDIEFWRHEVASELDRLLMENQKMQECRRVLEKAIQDLEGPLHIAQECLYHREFRTGAELVHDETEQALLKEIETVRNCQKKLEQFTDKCKNQLRNGRASQNELEVDVKNKETALGIDSMCHELNNFSRGLQYFGGIEKYNNNVVDAKGWSEFSENVVKRSQMERSRSCLLRSDIENIITTVSQEIWDAWSNSNNALARRSSEMIEARDKLQNHLHRVQQEIFQIEKNIELMKKAIMDKSVILKVAHTRLEARGNRPQAELCEDYAHQRLVHEVDTVNGMIHEMHLKLQQSEAQHQHLLRTKTNLEKDLKAKVDGLFVDREKCMGMRRSYPITTTIKY